MALKHRRAGNHVVEPGNFGLKPLTPGCLGRRVGEQALPDIAGRDDLAALEIGKAEEVFRARMARVNRLGPPGRQRFPKPQHTMKPQSVITSLLAACTLSFCVVPGDYGDAGFIATTTTGYGTGYGTYAALPPGFAGEAYFYGGRYYSGGRFESGRFRDRGREYQNRYYHNGHYSYGGRHEQHGGGGSRPSHQGNGPRQPDHYSPGGTRPSGDSRPSGQWRRSGELFDTRSPR